MAERYADPITLDHIIELKKQLADAERQRENALDLCMSLRKQISLLHDALEMVRDADEDCHKDGLPTIPPMARGKIDRALKGGD